MEQDISTELLGHSFNTIYNSNGPQTPQTPQTPNPDFPRFSLIFEANVNNKNKRLKHMKAFLSGSNQRIRLTTHKAPRTGAGVGIGMLRGDSTN